MIMDDLITVFMVSGKKVTGSASEDFVFVFMNDIRNFIIDNYVLAQEKEVIIKDHVIFIRKANSEETEYYRTHHFNKETL